MIRNRSEKNIVRSGDIMKRKRLDRNTCMYLFHYYAKEKGPFRTLSDLTNEEAIKIHALIEA